MRVALAACLVTAVALVAGCGSSGPKSNGVADKTPNQILAAAEAAALAASAVHVSGAIHQNGTPLTLDIHLVSGKGATGHMSENGVGFDIIRVGDKAYIRGSKAFYVKFAGPKAGKLLEGKWLVSSVSSSKFASLAPLTDQEKFFTGALGVHDKLTKGAIATVNGQKVIALTSGKNGGTLYVATTGQPYPIQLVSPGHGSEGKITFDQWGTIVPITAPKNAVDISKLTG